MKDALQCAECAMCCHRKCMEAANLSTKCKMEPTKIEFQVTESDEVCESIEGASYDKEIKRRKSSQFLLPNIGEALNQSLKRVNSTSNLNLLPLAMNVSANNSRSVPSTPVHTPR